MPTPQFDDPKSDILIIDDALPNLQVLSTMLAEHGYGVRGVANGPTALMVANAKPPDLILLDVRMPEMDGYQVCQRLKADEQTRDIPVIFISALDDLADKVQGFAVGGVDYITKPIQVEEVLARVQTHLTLRNLQTQFEAKNTRLEQEIIEREQAEAALQRAHDELEQRVAERTAELARALEKQQELDRLRSEFIRNVSHELRTPLALALGHAKLLEAGVLGELQPEQHESVAVIARRTRLLSKMMDNFAAIIDTETELQRRPVDLVELVHRLLTDSQVRATIEQADLTLSVKVAPDVPLVSGDPVQLQRVVDNLLNNAFKFTPAGGRVAVRLRHEEENLALEVADTGIGIPADQSERIFERYYQIDGSTTRRYGGIGLGLALVKEIIKAHGGVVEVKSEVGEGSTFTVTLPIFPVDLPHRTQAGG
jgi:signal transduction histidine kinase